MNKAEYEAELEVAREYFRRLRERQRKMTPEERAAEDELLRKYESPWFRAFKEQISAMMQEIFFSEENPPD